MANVTYEKFCILKHSLTSTTGKTHVSANSFKIKWSKFRTPKSNLILQIKKIKYGPKVE